MTYVTAIRLAFHTPQKPKIRPLHKAPPLGSFHQLNQRGLKDAAAAAAAEIAGRAAAEPCHSFKRQIVGQYKVVALKVGL